MSIYRVFIATLLLFLFSVDVAKAAVTPPQGIVGISEGTDFSCTATNLAEVYCWGKNDVGQLGIATPTINDGGYHIALNPVKVTGLSGVIAIASGSAHTCALRDDGTV